MHKYKNIILLLACLCSASISYAYCNLPDSTAIYDIYSRRSHVGKVLDTISFNKLDYSVKSSTKIGFFLLRDTLVQSSEGQFSKRDIQPKAYELSDLNKKTNNFINFYPKQHNIRGTFQSKVFESKQSNWPIYDPLSYRIALRCALTTSYFSQKTMRVFDNNHLHNYDIKVVSRNKIIDTAIGKLNTVEVKLLVLPEKIFAFLWFAKFRHMALVQSSLFVVGGKSVFSTIKSLKQKVKKD
ncbi:MAG: DUF3108 domain-containing protein [Coxiellaceae bacterium]|nr:DUF3108 domain-containing protein [Coxiellaceae bacterium]